MAEKTWELSGQYMESCNCDYLCPCIYTNPQAPATHEHCYALMVYRIDRGHHGGVSLDGLKFALVIRSGRVMADGGWVFGVVVDEERERGSAQGPGRDRERHGRRPAADDPRQPGEGFPRHRIQADRFHDRRLAAGSPTSRAC